MDDTLELLIHGPKWKDFQISTAGIRRKQEFTELDLDPYYKGDTVHVYCTRLTWTGKSGRIVCM